MCEKALNYELAELDYVNGMKYKEIAEKYQVSLNTVKSWKTRYHWSKKGAHKNDAHKNGKCAHTKSIREQDEQNDLSMQTAEPEEQDRLNDKQKLFCCLYVKCFNATKAYQKAYGCGYSTAVTNGSALLRKTHIKNEIQKLKQGRMNRELFSTEDVFQKYIDIAFADITDYVEFGGKTLQGSKEGNVVRFRESGQVDGTLISEIKGKDGARIKLADRMKALDWLSAHMDMATPEQKARINKLEAETERIVTGCSRKGEDDGIEIINDCPS